MDGAIYHKILDDKPISLSQNTKGGCESLKLTRGSQKAKGRVLRVSKRGMGQNPS